MNFFAAQSSAPPKIQEVSTMLRDDIQLVEYFGPSVVSLGPIHHGKEKYQRAETLKDKLAKKFVRNSGMTVDELCDAIKGQIKELREYFEEEVMNKYKDDDHLARIFVVDGCAILQFMYFFTRGEFKELNMKIDSATNWMRDMFLLENQVPYHLLELLMSLSQKQNEMAPAIGAFLIINNSGVLMNFQQSRLKQIMEQLEEQLGDQRKRPTHLLHLLRTSLLGTDKPTDEQKRWPSQLGQGDPQQILTQAQQILTQTSSDMEWISRDSHRNVQELKAAGIHVKQSAGNSLRDIYFSRTLNFYPAASLSLPPLIVDPLSVAKLLNLIAYEMCPDFENDLGVSFYICFLSSIIEGANDIKELTKAKVIYTLLGRDEVAQLFRTMCANVTPNIDQYMHLERQIQEYFGNKCLIWMAELYYDISSRPWKIIAFFGSLSALALTVTQTFYSSTGPCDDFCKKFT